MTQTPSELFDLAEKARQAYANDEIGTTPVGIFIRAYRLFYDAITSAPEPRFDAAARFLAELAEKVGELETDEDAPGVWRLWENARRVVDHYDRAKRRESATAAEDETTNDDETVATATPATNDDDKIDDETAAKIDEQIDAGTPARQVAAALGVDLEDVKKRATKRRAKE